MRERTSNDFCTPRAVLDLVERVGPIGLDPCSNPWSIVPARVKLSLDDGQDGLSADWLGLLEPGEIFFVNPPYGRGEMRKWAPKTSAEVERGATGIALVKGDHSTEWWRTLRRHVRAICYWTGRIAFGGGDGDSGRFASSLLYFGPSPHLFAHAFSEAGDVRVIR